jgi:hypothetical protein
LVCAPQLCAAHTTFARMLFLATLASEKKKKSFLSLSLCMFNGEPSWETMAHNSTFSTCVPLCHHKVVVWAGQSRWRQSFPLCPRSAVSRNVQEEEDKESRHSCEFHSALAIATHRKCTTNGQVKTLDGRAKKTDVARGSRDPISTCQQAFCGNHD